MNVKALHKLSYGLYVVSSRKNDRINGQIANAVFQVTSEPPTLAVCINKQNLTHEFIKESGVFAVSILAHETPLSFIGRFGFKSGREIDKFAGVNHMTGQSRAPVVTDHTLAYLEGKVTGEVDVGTHTIFTAQLVEADIIREGEPMTYAYYHEVKRGAIPRSAPSYIAEERESRPKTARYRCRVCGYIYDPDLGDPDGDVKPGTPFEELPEGWACPVCGAEKGEFERLD
jgi:flavin reductase (DIM6/NTAB) family NADH-FMN oxidoreductase RutF/rubredoxin